MTKKDKSLIDIYTPLSEAKEEIWRRWNDKELRKKVEEFLNHGILKKFEDAPKAVLSRYIATPNFELLYFLDSARTIDLEPLCFEYYDDKFVGKNDLKYYLCKLYFDMGEGKRGGRKTDCFKVVDFDKLEGKRFSDIRTLENKSLIDFHHDMLSKIDQNINFQTIDFSDWFNKTRNESEYYYLYYLALFLCHGILFENFLVNKEEKDFTENKVLPSFYKLEEMFGVRPLIVPLSYFADEAHQHWQHYPESFKKHIKK